MWQTVITRCFRYYKCVRGRLLLQGASGTTSVTGRLFLQSALGITKCDSYYKVRRNKGSKRLPLPKVCHTYLTVIKSSKVVLINMVAILMILAKLAPLGLLKTKIFWNKGYDVILSVYDVTDKLLSLDSNYIVDAIMWSTFGKCCTSLY